MEKLFKSLNNQSKGVVLKKFNQKKQIVKELYFNGPKPNSSLSNKINLSTPKINSLLIELIEDGLVVDIGQGNSSGGRRPNIYSLVNKGFYVVGISLGVQKTSISVFNSNNEDVTGPKYFPVKIKSDFGIFTEINNCLNKILNSFGIDRRKIIVGGIEMPGLVNSEKGHNLTYFKDHTNLQEELTSLFEFPVFFENDAKLRTFTEQHYGLAKGKENALMVYIDWGVGLGMLINGQLHIGNSGYAGEFGHLPIVDNGILCKCGKHGCLETIASGTAIARLAKEGIKAGSPSLLKDIVEKDIERIDTSMVIQAANDGDQFAISILSDVAYWLGKGMAHLIQIFNPRLIIIGGVVADAKKFMIAPIQQAIHTYSNHDISNDTEIKFSKLGAKAGVLGASSYALEKL